MQAGHTGGDAVFNLLVDEAAFVGHDGIDELDAAIDDARVALRTRRKLKGNDDDNYSNSNHDNMIF